MFFSKMHGLGNDFMIVDSITQDIVLNSEIVRRLSDRNFGVGFDQLLVVENSCDPKIDFYYRIYNSDGTEVTQCANGIRCFAQFVYMKKLTDKNTICISTKTSRMVVSISDNDQISVNMGQPIFEPKYIPFYAMKIQKIYILYLYKQTVLCGVVSLGNPHCVVLVEDINKVSVSILGSFLEKHHCFPKKVNVSFMQILDCKNIKLRVYERNVGETKSCGSAACAAVAVGIYQGLLSKSVKVNFLYGNLLVTWNGFGYPLYMIGESTHVYDGFISI